MKWLLFALVVVLCAYSLWRGWGLPFAIGSIVIGWIGAWVGERTYTRLFGPAKSPD